MIYSLFVHKKVCQYSVKNSGSFLLKIPLKITAPPQQICERITTRLSGLKA
jgi:hypothetical protein